MIAAAAAFFCLWLHTGYPRYKFIKLPVDRHHALAHAREFLRGRGVEPGNFKTAVTFASDDWASRYLQRTLKLDAAEDFIGEHGYDIFYWQIRFFREFEKEEFSITVSAGTGEVISCTHLIDDITGRATPDKEAARRMAQEFLEKTYHLDFSAYESHDERTKRYDKRTDYAFSWEKKGVYIPWRKEQGGAKLLTGATVSGDEVRAFYKMALDIPDKFDRDVQKQLVFGEFLYSISFFSFIALVGWSIALIIKRRQGVVAKFCKKWYTYLGFFFLAVNATFVFNCFQNIISGYQTSASLASYFALVTGKFLLDVAFMALMFVIPGIAGESLRDEVFPGKKYSSFLPYLRSTFLGRSFARSIMVGYIFFVILISMQAVIFYYGQKHLGVWNEWVRMVVFSSAYIPALSAFALSSSAALNEEIVFRLFGISVLKRHLKFSAAAVAVSSFIWGLGHTGYAIFPVWFRGIEMTCLGIVFGWVFLRYGLVSCIVAHYLFDVFWCAAPHLLGRSMPLLFATTFFALMFPAITAGIACVLNRREDERPMTALLDKIQQYNLKVLTAYISAQKASGRSGREIRSEVLSHHWDHDVIELALRNVFPPDQITP